MAHRARSSPSSAPLAVATPDDDECLLQAADPNLRCAICQGIFTNPMRTQCGHVFCAGCLSAWLPSSSSCPECRSAVEPSSLSPDRLADRLVSNLQGFCAMRDAGCTWVGKRGDAARHLATECECVPVYCPHAGCGAEVARRDLAAHLASCPAAAVARGAALPPREQQQQQQLEQLGQLDQLGQQQLLGYQQQQQPSEVECPFGCGARRPMGEALERHMQHECAFEPRKLMAAVSHLAAENERLTRENERLLRAGATPTPPTALSVGVSMSIAAGASGGEEPRTAHGSRKSARRSLGPGLAVD